MRARPRRFPLLALAFWIACSRGPVRKPGDEYVSGIEVEGNHALGDKELVTGLGLRRAQRRTRPVDAYVVQIDADRIRGQYFRHGYLGIAVLSRVEHAGDAATVIFSVDEGARAVTVVDIAGIADPALLETVRARLTLRDGAPFDYAMYDASKAPLLFAVQEAGYAHARLDASVDADPSTNIARVHLRYELGPLSTFGTTTITGVDGALAAAIRARLQFTRGAPFSMRALAATRRSLYGLAPFATMQVEPDTTSGDPAVGVRIAAAETAHHEVKLGGGVGIDPLAYEVRGRAGYALTGWPSTLDTVTLEARPAYAYLRAGGFQPRMRALARLERQDLVWTHSKGDVEAAYKYFAVEAYTIYGPRGGLGFGTPLWTERVQLHAGWGIEYLAFRNVSPLIDPALQMELGLDQVERIGTYTQTLSVDLRDRPLEPRRGIYAEIRTTEGTRYAGGAFNYLELIPEVRGFVPVGPVVIAARIRAGTINGDVPVTERLFSGGASSHRGFGERALAPTVSGLVDGAIRYVPYGGAALLETGIEARFPVTSWRKIGIGGVVFLDGGDVTNARSELDPLGLHWAIGTGVRFRTIAGPLRADFGYRLNRVGPDEPSPGTRFAFHLSVGDAF